MATTGVAAYSTTAGSNTTVGGVSVAEGMSPASVNNAMRAQMADFAVYRNLVGGATTTGGSGNAQTLTTGMTLAAYQQGLQIGFEAGFTNTTTTTLNVDGIGAKTVKLTTGANLYAGAITAGGIYLVAYESGADVLYLLNPSLTVPTMNGIAFPATQSASSNANTLDDYEEGTWTPVLAFGGASVGITYGTQTGTYTKIGRLVYIRCTMTLTSRGSSTGTAVISGLPFTPAVPTALAGSADNYTIGAGLIPQFDTSSTTIILRTLNPTSGNRSQVAETQVDNDCSLLLMGSFEV